MKKKVNKRVSREEYVCLKREVKGLREDLNRYARIIRHSRDDGPTACIDNEIAYTDNNPFHERRYCVLRLYIDRTEYTIGKCGDYLSGLIDRGYFSGRKDILSVDVDRKFKTACVVLRDTICPTCKYIVRINYINGNYSIEKEMEVKEDEEDSNII